MTDVKVSESHLSTQIGMETRQNPGCWDVEVADLSGLTYNVFNNSAVDSEYLSTVK